jgi:hypothetical protein
MAKKRGRDGLRWLFCVQSKYSAAMAMAMAMAMAKKKKKISFRGSQKHRRKKTEEGLEREGPRERGA